MTVTDTSSDAFYRGIRHTQATLRNWRYRPAPILIRWVMGSTIATLGLLLAVLAISAVAVGSNQFIQLAPPFALGNISDVLAIFSRNLLVLSLHAMACVAGFIAGSSLPLQAEEMRGVSRWIHEQGGRIAIAFVFCATAFSLSAQSYVLGHTLANVADFLKVSPVLLLLGVLPHAIPELVALFLPLAAWIVASWRGQWDQLLAATLVTVAIALPILLAAAFTEVYISPHLFAVLTGIR